MARIRVFASLLVAVCSLRAFAQTEPPIASELAELATQTDDSYLSSVSPDLSRFYGERQYQAIWTGASGFNAAARSVLRVLANADRDGLSPNDYLISPLAAASIRLGLERLRWLPDEFTARRVGVNLADFRVYVLDDDVVTFETGMCLPASQGMKSCRR